MIGAVFVLPLMSAVAPAAGHPGTVSGTPDPAQIVRPTAAGILAPTGRNPGSRKLLEAYYDSILRWSRTMAARTRRVPGVDGRRYLGLPNHIEDHVRPTAYAAMVLGFLAEFHPPQSPLSAGDCAQIRTACWFTWPQLNAALQRAIVGMVVFEADRFIRQPPKSRLHNDTGAEENAWGAARRPAGVG